MDYRLFSFSIGSLKESFVSIDLNSHMIQICLSSSKKNDKYFTVWTINCSVFLLAL